MSELFTPITKRLERANNYGISRNAYEAILAEYSALETAKYGTEHPSQALLFQHFGTSIMNDAKTVKNIVRSAFPGSEVYNNATKLIAGTVDFFLDASEQIPADTSDRQHTATIMRGLFAELGDIAKRPVGRHDEEVLFILYGYSKLDVFQTQRANVQSLGEKTTVEQRQAVEMVEKAAAKVQQLLPTSASRR